MRIGLALILCFFSNLCSSGKAGVEGDSGKVCVLCTTAMIEDIVQEVGGKRVLVDCLIRGELDPHRYELVKGDDEKFARASLVFYNGLGLEHGRSLRQNLEKNPKAIAVSQKIVDDSPALLLYASNQLDPHIWMDISLWSMTIPVIVDALSEKDPQHAHEFTKRGEALRQNLLLADAKAREQLSSLPKEKRYLVTSHNAFRYFTRRYLAPDDEVEAGTWEVRCNAPEGLAPEAELSCMDILRLVDHIHTFSVTTLFPESNVSHASLEKIQNASLKKGREVHFSTAHLYGDGMGDAPSYLSMMRHNVRVIAEELKAR